MSFAHTALRCCWWKRSVRGLFYCHTKQAHLLWPNTLSSQKQRTNKKTNHTKRSWHSDLYVNMRCVWVLSASSQLRLHITSSRPCMMYEDTPIPIISDLGYGSQCRVFWGFYRLSFHTRSPMKLTPSPVNNILTCLLAWMGSISCGSFPELTYFSLRKWLNNQ